MSEKTCRLCKESLPISEFNRYSQNPDGLDTRCKSCHRSYNTPKRIAAGPERAMLYSARTRAKQLCLPFDLTIDDIIIPERCPVFGLTLRSGLGKGSGLTDESPTLDRMIPALGYVRSNVAVISWRANRLKSDLTANEAGALIRFLRDPGGPLILRGPPPRGPKPEGPVSRCIRIHGKQYASINGCYDCRSSYIREREAWRGPEDMMLSCARRRARKFNLEFTLTLDHIHIPERCPALDIPLTSYLNTGGRRGGRDDSPVIDRLDNAGGYTPENCRVISYRANRIKSDGTADEFEMILDWILATTIGRSAPLSDLGARSRTLSSLMTA